MAPVINSRLRSRWPIFDVLPSLGLPPVVCWRGTRPSQAEKSRPRWKPSIGGANAWSCHRRNRPDPRYRHQPRSLFVLARAGIEIRLQASDLHLELGNLSEQKAAQLPDRLRQPRVRILHGPCQPADMGRPLRSCDAVLRQMTTQSVDRLRALAHQQVPRA